MEMHMSLYNDPCCSFKPGLARSLGNLYSLDDFVDTEDDDTPAPSYPALPHSLLPSGPPPPRFGFGYPVPSFQQEVNNNLNSPPAPAHRPARRGNFRPSIPRVPVSGVFTGRHFSRSIPVSGLFFLCFPHVLTSTFPSHLADNFSFFSHTPVLS